jgi:DNA-binding MarR family transcriptional regulator
VSRQRDECVAATADAVHSAAIRLLRHARTSDTASGLTAARLSVLSVLVFGGPRSVTQLAAAEQVAAPTMTRLLQGLEADAYIRRTRDSADGRQMNITATAKGKRALEAARAARLRRLAALLEPATAEELLIVEAAAAVLFRLLDRSSQDAR